MEQSPFQIRGVIEGFYGPFYTFPERNDLIQFMGQHGYNLYIYAPKNDRQHRHRWWEPYPPEIMEQFAEAVTIAAEAEVQFCYAISPLNYDPRHDFPRLTQKLQGLYERGVRAFSLLLDDLLCAVHHQTNCKRCVWPAETDIEMCNRLYDWLVSLDQACTLSVCPTEYHGQAPFSAYLHALGAGLYPQIDIFYTGPDVCSPRIATADAAAFGQAAGRAPLIWDNYPVNDLAMRPSMHIGPIDGRDATLYQAVRGVVVNTMLQPEASKIPLLTFAAYFADPHGYDPWHAWERALGQLGGNAHEALARFGENALRSCLPLAETPRLERLTAAAVDALRRGERLADSKALQSLGTYLNTLDEACYILKNRMANLRLRHDLLPWIEALDEWLWVGKRALRVLEVLGSGQQAEHLVRGLTRSLEESKLQSKRTSGNAVLALALAVLEHAAACSNEQLLLPATDAPFLRAG